MKGSYSIRVENARVQFKLTLTRSLTLIRGMSATGKSTLVGLLSEYQQDGPASGITLSSPKPCIVPSVRSWREDIANTPDSFVFLDEGNSFVRTEEFARIARDSGNYFVIVSREELPMLPYSVEEVYELRNTTSHYPGIRKFFTHAQRMYTRIPGVENPQVVIVEDSNAGYEFFNALCKKDGIKCMSAHGKGNVLTALRECDAERILVVADGAAFGPQMEAVLDLARRKGAGLFLPESFEWLILKSGLVRDADIPKMLDDPAAYVESSAYFSWERFFTALLVDKTVNTYLHYQKANLNPAYLQERERSAIEAQLGQTGISSLA